MQDSALKRSLYRLFWMSLAGVVTAAIAWVTNEYANAVWYPMVYWVLTTVKDIINPKLPNVPKA